MSSILETIAAEVGPGTLAGIGAAVGATPAQTQSVFAAALPALVGGLAKNASAPEGAQALASALDRDHAPNLLESLAPMAGALLGGGGGLASLAGSLLGGGGGAASNLGSLLGALAGGAPASAPKALNGAGILGHIFGGAPKAEGAASSVANASGVDAGTVMKLMPLLAPIVMSALGSLKKKNGLDANGMTSLLQNEATTLQAPAPKDDGFGVDDLMKVGTQLASSGLLGKLFG
jgi:hypothetical protein